MIEKNTIEDFQKTPNWDAPAIWPDGKPFVQMMVSDCVTDIEMEDGGKSDFGYTYFINVEFDDFAKRDSMMKHQDITDIINDIRSELQQRGNPTLREDNDNPDGFSDYTEQIFNEHIIPETIDSMNKKYNLGMAGGYVADSMEVEGCTVENYALSEPERALDIANFSTSTSFKLTP